MKTKRISASLMCANPIYLKKTLDMLDIQNIDYLHIDIMDGHFVPNLGIGIDYLKILRSCTSLPFDYHLMVLNPEDILPLLDLQPDDIVSIHYESSYRIQKTLSTAKNYNCKVFLAINPSTSINVLEELLCYIDGINVLMVKPGFAGQKIIPSCISKTVELQGFLSKQCNQNIDIEVDGNITFENANKLSKIGANIFVAGTSSIFGYDGIIEGSISMLRKSISCVI